MGRLFGTDGIRGLANEYPMTPDLSLKLGQALGEFILSKNFLKSVVIGKDTRISSDMFLSAMTAGLSSMGIDIYNVGVIPTPAVAFLTSLMEAGAGIMISASHNPFYDNGIKFFKSDGFKFLDYEENEIENLVFEDDFSKKIKSIRDLGRFYEYSEPLKKYSTFLKGTLSKPNQFKAVKVVIDCANGASHRVAPELFLNLCSNVYLLFSSPNGKNINEKCGSQYPEALAETVVREKADIGLAFDGDGDRVIAVDEKGNVLTGDQILAIFAKYLKTTKKLKNNIVVSTVMSNIGLGQSLKKMGINHSMSKIGDRYVLKKMKECQAFIGGEDSGHMIFLDFHTTGDGILSGLKLIEAMLSESLPLSELSKVMTVFPQLLLNIEIKQRINLEENNNIVNVIKNVEEELQDMGRVLVRYSGTQPICRVMLEAQTISDAKKYGQKIKDIILKEHSL